MDIGSGVAIAGTVIPLSAVAITAIRTFASKQKDDCPGGGDGDGNFPCKEHSGLVMCMENIEKNQERQERWLGEISSDVKNLFKEEIDEMNSFGALSKEQLLTCDERLQKVFNEVIKYFDCKIIEGHRGEALQRLYFKQGKTKLDWPNGKHNSIPSKGVDVMPCPINWFDKERLCYFAGFVMGVAMSMSIKLRWGKDWDGDTDLNDQTFQDGPHWEIIN